ncbi:hypothetical protein E2C01_082565 [Portunus trituberculatus]|uniref:Uncharacterized protein n=1 Tax=Portunus trituberculatus TaxID=210409 RepID=A0A5B7IZL7_PORTR|nr:hypothetical protein [Portunus trituberculatus]
MKEVSGSEVVEVSLSCDTTLLSPSRLRAQHSPLLLTAAAFSITLKVSCPSSHLPSGPKSTEEKQEEARN